MLPPTIDQAGTARDAGDSRLTLARIHPKRAPSKGSSLRLSQLSDGLEN
jgi:hypothetical protein